MESKNKVYCALAEKLVDEGKNVIVRPCFGKKNYLYNKTWNTYAEEKGLFVKFIDELTTEDTNYVIIDVGFPTSSSSSSEKNNNNNSN